ncbi:MAG: hypothetical protein AB8B86_16080 [Pseudomonadales bacterium]
MNNTDYLLPGIAAIAVAVLHPIYWISEVSFTAAAGAIRTDIGLLDGLYVVLAGLTIFIYYSLREILNDHCEYHGFDTLISIILYTSTALFILLLVVSLFFSDTSELPMTVAFPTTLLIFGATDLLLGIQLLRDSDHLPGLVKAFAVVILVGGICNLSIIFSGLGLVLFPVAALILALMFLRKPETVEFV